MPTNSRVSNMSQILRAVLFAAYIALLIRFLKLMQKEETRIEIEYIVRSPGSLKKIMRGIKKVNKGSNEYQYSVLDRNFEKPFRLPTDFKYVLKWTKAMTHYSDPDFMNGQRPFLDHECKFYNCFMTNDKNLLLDVKYFDAILFDAENDWDLHPETRALHQKYIFTATEPAGLYPICDPVFNNYYNWTWSYKLDSTIIQPFYNVYYKNGIIAGPQLSMRWISNYFTIPLHMKSFLNRKSKLAAWFVSHCKTKSKRETFVAELNKFLGMYNFTIDIYGLCGKHACPRDDLNSCMEMLQRDYYFYLSFENSIDEDYVTEKVLHALNYYTVPVVFGGANYSRFLPPDSFINARTMSPGALASLMIELSRDLPTYYTYFAWHHNYYFKANSQGSNLCQLCQLLNESPQYSVIENFTHWWNADGSCQKITSSVAKELSNQIS